MAKIDELTTQQPDQWMAAIERCAPYDFYHLPQYHALAEEAGEGAARLFVYTEETHTIALPLLLRSLDDIQAGAVIGAGWKDATSVYGYAGPLISATDIPHAVVRNFQAALERVLPTNPAHVIAPLVHRGDVVARIATDWVGHAGTHAAASR